MSPKMRAGAEREQSPPAVAGKPNIPEVMGSDAAELLNRATGLDDHLDDAHAAILARTGIQDRLILCRVVLRLEATFWGTQRGDIDRHPWDRSNSAGDRDWGTVAVRVRLVSSGDSGGAGGLDVADVVVAFVGEAAGEGEYVAFVAVGSDADAVPVGGVQVP